MGIGALHTRYREWARDHGSAGVRLLVPALGTIGGLCVVVLTRLFGGSFLIWKIGPWIMLVLGAIAALDAFGAEEFRGSRSKGLLRAAVILFFFWGFPAYAWSR